jgi:hypothetical protein
MSAKGVWVWTCECGRMNADSSPACWECQRPDPALQITSSSSKAGDSRPQVQDTRGLHTREISVQVGDCSPSLNGVNHV